MNRIGERSVIEIILEFFFFLLIFSLGFMQPQVEIRGISITVTDLIFLIVCGIWFLGLVCRKLDVRFDRIYFLFALYALGLLLSATFSENPRLSIFKYLGEIYLIGLAVMTLNLVRRTDMVKKVVFVWLAASAVSAAVATMTVVMFYLGTSNFLTDFSLHDFGSLPPGNYPRIQSTFLYPSMLCNYFTVSLMMLLAARRLAWVSRSMFTILIIGFAITIAFTLTPGIGGVFLTVGIWFWFVLKDAKRTALSKLALSGGVFAPLCFLVVSTFTVFNSPTSPYYYSIAGVRIDPTQRLLTWGGALHTFIEHPIFGKGLGLGVANVMFMPPSGRMQLLTDAHNIWLSIAGQSGLFGLISLVLICVAIIWRSRLFDLDASNDLSVIRWSLGIAFVSVFLYQGLVGSFEDARHLWVLIGLILAVGRTADGGPPEVPLASSCG